ncbi:hypothetical protein O1611_g6359 [Lasiodiplodia mahajangana]|uniref:Uncharacterized protein n=1 Tax=Lasiodiplodia mahajangana TaxID=1108764 RepID=A0ACC2JIL8_9PEZI|nr:hypothetical protein O1611_g6359 [Lasiodiplodia mahajangana]
MPCVSLALAGLSVLELRQANQEDDANLVLEIVTVVDTSNSDVTGTSANEFSTHYVANSKDTYMIVHSKALSEMIRDAVEYYPGQNLAGTTLVLREPYACLMHHMSDLEYLAYSEKDPIKLEHIQVLLGFLRPRYQQQYVPAKERYLSTQPTVRFEDLWVAMKPGVPAYAEFNRGITGCVVGCVIGEVIRLPPKPSQDLPGRWSIDFWFLQVHWPSDEIGCTRHTITITLFDGEKPITSLPIYPAEILDATDQGTTKRRFVDRGRKVRDILWGQSMYMEYDGECMDIAKQRYTGQIIVGGSYGIEEIYPKHNWEFVWVPPSEVMKEDPDVPLSVIEFMVDPKRDDRDILTHDHFFILSPCLSAFTLPNKNWMLLTVEKIRPLTDHDLPPLYIDPQKLSLIQALVDSPSYKDAPSPLPSQGKRDGTIILLHGQPGVGKSYTVEHISVKSRRPLLTLDQKDIGLSLHKLEDKMAGWFALILINLLRRFEGILFLTTSKVQLLDFRITMVISLSIFLPPLDRKTQDSIWLDLGRDFDTKEGIRFHRNATKFLASPGVRQVNWNGHEIHRCFKTAMALARAQAKHTNDNLIVIDDDHLKEAMNVAPFSSNHIPRRLVSSTSSEDGKSKIDETDITFPLFGLEDRNKPALETPRRPVTLNSDSDLCIPDMQWTEWDAFRAAGRKEPFSKTKFHAIDVLKGEPLITFQIGNTKRRKHQYLSPKPMPSSSAIINAANQDKYTPKKIETSTGTLPERIRINSPAIIRTFAEIHGNSIPGPFLLFRPFRSLLYYEQEFHDAISQQDIALQEWSTRKPRAETNEEEIENETERKILSDELEQMRCLISFIENEIKKKQERLRSPPSQAVPFADIPLIFSPGDTVISKDHKQAYRVTMVNCIRHRVKNRKETSHDFWKDESQVQFEDNPVFVHCTYVDFDGELMGPVRRLFTIPRYDGRKEVTSLPIFPLQYVKEDGLRETLVERGKLFFKVASVKHMHYTGLGLTAREEIDSRVVIDFEEAIDRYPDWKPSITSALEDVDIPNKDDQDADLKRLFKAQESTERPCVEECCANETTHYDEYVEDRRREDYIVSQMNRDAFLTPSVAIIPRAFHDIAENNTLTDDEYLIMSYRVFGFVLRSRKWYELDMTCVFEVATLDAGEGFDELVLPPGHGDVVKSMIRQHLRDRNLSSINREKTDIVRGKGRGLIFLLHGVPGVGKTSTAECVADLFRRPLFQITSGDLGTTAREVEDSLEENFSLASRWNSILLIDEADVFLSERTKEDFIRNSLVAVFLRMLEYYAGVLFLTTNRVGVFDEAFTSRIHISLYYPPLDRKSTLQIFEKNWGRIKTRYKKAGRDIDINTSEITDFAIDYFEGNKESRWNGRQIRNAFQSALALAELDALGTDDFLSESDHNRRVILSRKNFDTVAESHKGFTSYLKQVYGADFARRARENLWRFDAFGSPRMPNSLNTRLKIPELAVPSQPPPPPPPPGQWAGQGYVGYDPRNPHPYYPPPPHHYSGQYDHPSQGPRYPSTPGQHPNPISGERLDPRSGAEEFGQSAYGN